MHKFLATGVTAFLLGLGSATANATTLTFDLNPGWYGPTHSEGGYVFSNSIADPFAFLSWGNNQNDADTSSSSATLMNGQLGTVTKMTASGGSSFKLHSMDFADTYNEGDPTDISFHFVFANGGILDRLVTLDAAIGLQTILFGLDNLSSVEWGTASWAQFDNITVVAATPLPAALPLFASAITAIGFAGWCRRKRAPATAQPSNDPGRKV